MKKCRIYVHNIDKRTTADDLEMMVSLWGDVGKIKIRNESGIIEMLAVSGAQRACKNLDGTVLWGRSLKVRMAEENSHGLIARLIPSLFLGRRRRSEIR